MSHLTLNNKFSDIIIVGDAHGFDAWNYLISKKHVLYDCLLIQIGDFGVGFSKSVNADVEKLYNLELFLKQTNNRMIVIRGNHDDPKFFNGSFKYKDEWSTDQNLWLLSDYSVVTIESKKILLVGGGVSIDKDMRKKDVNWWEDEKFVYSENHKQSIENEKFDIVCTHIAPDFCSPHITLIGKGNDVEFDNIMKESIEERLHISRLYNDLKNKPKKWFYGHYHCSYRMKREETEFIGLGENEFKSIY